MMKHSQEGGEDKETMEDIRVREGKRGRACDLGHWLAVH